MSCIIAVANQKGGVGKTTSTVNLASSLVYLGSKVLIVDLDPQGNATTGSGINKGSIKNGTYQVLLSPEEIMKSIIISPTGRYDVLPSNRSLAGAEIELVQEIARELRLKTALEYIRSSYDYIFIDCPPTLTLLTLNGLTAADYVLIPMVCEYYALEGISDLIATIRKIKQSKINIHLEIIGVLRTMYDKRSNLARQVSQELKFFFHDDIFKISIPRNVRVAEAPSYGMPVLNYDKNAKGSKAYLDVAKELKKKIKKRLKEKE